MSGWNQTKLQSVLDQCETDSFDANPNSFCEDFLTFRDTPKCTDDNMCDFTDPALLERIKDFQPPPLDVLKLVSPEETAVVRNELPRGTCIGELLNFEEGVGTSTATSWKLFVSTTLIAAWILLSIE